MIDLTKVPIIGGVVNKLDAAARGAVQRVTEQVAEFKLVPQRLRNVAPRIDRLMARTGPTIDYQELANSAQAITTTWFNVNGNVDRALDIIRGGIPTNPASLATVAAAATGIKSVLDQTKSLEDRVRQEEAKAGLSPLSAQLAGPSFGLLAVLAFGAAAIAYARPRR